MFQVSRAPVRPLCHLICRQQTWQSLKGHIRQPSSLACDSGNRACDFQAWGFSPGGNCRPLVSDGHGIGRQQRRPIEFSFGEQRPCHAGQFVGQGHGYDVAVGTGCELTEPGMKTGGLPTTSARSMSSVCISIDRLQSVHLLYPPRGLRRRTMLLLTPCCFLIAGQPSRASSPSESR